MGSISRAAAVRLSLILAALIIAVHFFATQGNYEQLRGHIPNQVHYAFLLKEPEADFHFNFAQFLSIYSAWYYWRPHTFFIHTDATQAAICRAQGRCKGDKKTNKWTRLIFSMPNVRVNRVSAPARSRLSDVPITMIEHKADFVRVDAVHQLGGIFLDWDAFPLRDIAPLRKSGFAAIGGREWGGDMQSGTWMCRAGSLMSKLWSEQQHVVFDGDWTTHSNKLITKLGQRLVNLPGEFLIMDQLAFTPGGWDFGQQDMMFRVHEDFPSALTLLGNHHNNSVPANLTFPDDDLNTPVLERMEHPEMFPSWAFDFSSTYLFHAYKIWEFKVDGFDKITPRYVLQRQSNFARAVFAPAFDAYRRGIINVDDAFEA
jgi:hypothetical protein